MPTHLPLAFLSLGPAEMVVLAGLGLLLFGKRLPEVGRGMGQAIVQFKRGLKDVETEIDDAADKATVRENLDAPKQAAAIDAPKTETPA